MSAITAFFAGLMIGSFAGTWLAYFTRRWWLRETGPVSALAAERESWEARCHFCGGPSYAWMTDDETWAKVEPLLGQSQACFECFGAAWMLLGLNNGEPFRVETGQ